MYTNTIAHVRPLRLNPLAACLLPMLALGAPVLAATTAPPALRAAPTQLASSAVTSCDDDGDFDTLRHAVLVANSGDTIKLSGLACSKITLQAGAITVAASDLTIEGPAGGTFTIDGGGTDRVFVHGGPGTLSLTDLTVTNGLIAGDKAIGGCIYTKGNLSLTRSTVTSCKAIGQTLAFGGGAVAYGDMALDASTVTGNLADAVAAAKSAAMGGGVVSLGQNKGLTVMHSVVSGNTAHATGGKAYGGGAAGFGFTAKYSTFSGNAAKAIGDATSYGVGGGMIVLYSLSMSNSTVDHNEADFGGGILVGANSGFATIIQSTISTNKGRLLAGGIESGVPLSMTNSTVAFNTGGVYGGGGVLAAGELTMQSCIVADNAPSDVDGSVTVGGSNNLIKIAGANTTVPMGTLTVDPMFLPLAFNGGTTRTHALEAGSPAIDAGSNVLSLSSDQRDTAYPRVVGALPDMGAVEFDPDHIFASAFGSL